MKHIGRFLSKCIMSGGRGGDFPISFPVNEKFLSGLETYIYEADTDCVEHMSKGRYVDHVIPAVVAGADGEGSFNINYDPCTSSLLPMSESCREYYYQHPDCDYTLADVLRPVSVRKLKLRSMDTLAKEHQFSVDYLSLDVQGSEYDLLSGISDDTLKNTIAVMCEVSLLVFYDSQGMFEDIVALLRKKGFFVGQFNHHPGLTTFRTGIGWRGTGFSVHADVLFFRDTKHIVENLDEPFLALLKVAFVALSYGNVSYALQALVEAYKRPNRSVLNAAEHVGYIGFLDKMYQLYLETPQIFPPSYGQLWSAEASFTRFSLNQAVVPDAADVRAAYFKEVDENLFKEMAPRLMNHAPSAFESHLRENGFSGIADDVVGRRLTGIENTLWALGMAVQNGKTVIAPRTGPQLTP